MGLPPPEALPLARCDRFPEYRRPLPVDLVAGDGRPVRPGVNARFHVGVLDYARGDFDLVQYHRTPWARMNLQWKYAMATMLSTRAAANAVVNQTVHDDLIQFFGPSATNPEKLYNNSDTHGGTDFQLGYFASGPNFDPASAFFQTPLTSGPTYDDALFQVSATGSATHTDTTRNEFNFALALQKWQDDDGVNGVLVRVDESTGAAGASLTPGVGPVFKVVSLTLAVQF